MTTALFIAALVLAVFTAIPFVHDEAWWIRLFDFPRLQVAVLCGAVLVLLGVFWTPGWMAWATLGLALTALVVQAAVVLPYTPLWPTEVADAEGGHPTLKLVIANVLMTNRESAGLLAFIRRHAPDLVVLDEPDAWWEERFRQIEDAYPHTLKDALPNTYGMLLYAREPFAESEQRYLIEDGVPSFHVTVPVGGQDVRMHFIHPKPPFPKEAPTSAPRDAELVVVGRMAAEETRPVIVAGDLNDVAWSRTTRLFQKVSRLLDPRRGRGFFNTFHADHVFARWPLDHLFHSDHFRLVRLERGPAYGSDHFPIFAELELDPAARAEQHAPEPDAEDGEEARRKVEEAQKETGGLS